VMITGGNPRATTGVGFGFLPGAVIDQHFLRRNRANRLLGVLDRHPGLVGFGIDEGTALVCSGDEVRAIGRSYVSVFVPQPGGKPIRIEILENGEKASLAALIKDAARRK
jgi:cyanophycinase